MMETYSKLHAMLGLNHLRFTFVPKAPRMTGSFRMINQREIEMQSCTIIFFTNYDNNGMHAKHSIGRVDLCRVNRSCSVMPAVRLLQAIVSHGCNRVSA